MRKLVILWCFRCDHCKYLPSVNKIVLTKLDEYFSAILSNVSVLHGSSLHSALEHGTYISQGSVATNLRVGGIFYYRFTAYLLLSLWVNEL